MLGHSLVALGNFLLGNISFSSLGCRALSLTSGGRPPRLQSMQYRHKPFPFAARFSPISFPDGDGLRGALYLNIARPLGIMDLMSPARSGQVEMLDRLDVLSADA